MGVPNPDKAAPSARQCPLCDTATDAVLCPVDGMSTLLARPPDGPIRALGSGDVVAGRYRIERVLGSGGFATVYEARHAGTGQSVALKVLSACTDEEVTLRRFFREARVTAGLRHPSTVRVFDFGQDDSGVVFIAMELLVGRSLRQEIRDRLQRGEVFPQADAVRIATTVLRSLSEAHGLGLVHRDLKPDNIFLHDVGDDEPVVKVLDFGIVKMRDGTLTTNSSSLGTPLYMSPEQVMSTPIDARSDLYSLGVLLYQLVSGTLPFKAESSIATALLHVNETARPIEEIARTPLTPAFVTAIKTAMAKRPEDRFSDARAMRAALEASLTPAERPPPTPALVAAHSHSAAAETLLDTPSVPALTPHASVKAVPALVAVPRAITVPPAHTGPATSRKVASPAKPREGAPLVGATPPRTPVPAASRRTRSRWPWALASVAVVAGAAAIAWTQQTTPRQPTPQPAAPDEKAAVTTTTPPAAPSAKLPPSRPVVPKAPPVTTAPLVKVVPAAQPAGLPTPIVVPPAPPRVVRDADLVEQPAVRRPLEVASPMIVRPKPVTPRRPKPSALDTKI